MRLLFITHCTAMGGANIAMLNLIKEYQKSDIRTFVVLPKDGRELEDKLDELGAAHQSIAMPWWVCDICEGKKSLSIPQKLRMYMGNLRGVLQIIPLIYKWKIDIIHTNSTVVAIGALAAHITGRPHVWHLREALSFFDWDFMPPSSFVQKLFKYSDKVIAISGVCMQIYGPYLVEKKTRIIYDGAEVSEEKDGACGLEEGVFHILYLGGMSESKGCMDILGAALELKKSSPQKFKIWMPGCKKDGKVDAALYDFMIKNGLEFYLEPLEYLEKSFLDQLRYQMNLFIMPSSLEMFGLVTVEAMLSHVPVIASNTGANPEIVEDGKNGFLYSYGDIGQLADLILKVMGLGDNVREMVNCAYKEAREKYSMSVCAKNTRNVYKELLSKR